MILLTLQKRVVFPLTALLVVLLVACQPIQPVMPEEDADMESSAGAQPATIVLPDGTACAWAGEGATLAFDGKRVNYTCAETEGTIIGLLGDPMSDAMAYWTVEKATISHGDDGFTLQESETVTFLLALLDLADGSQCAFAGEGATMAFDGKRLNYTCGESDTEVIAILGDLIADEAGVYLAEKVTIDRSGSEPVIQETAQVPVMQIHGEAVVVEEGSAMRENELIGTLWQWQRTEMSDDMVFSPDEPANYTLTFLADGQLQVQLDCNKGRGSYTLIENQFTIGPVASTMMACLPESLDSTFGQQLSQVSSYLVDDEGNLVLLLQADSGSMIFAPADQMESSAPATETAILTGTVTYLQRMALPPGSVIEVQLQDVSRADAAAEVIASQTITTSGENVPIPFSLTYESAQIDPRFTYAIAVRITIDGQLRWINTDQYRVLTGDAPTSGIEVIVRPAQ